MFEQEIAGLVVKKFKLKEDEVLNLLEVPPNPEMGDYAFPCFTLAKELKKNPAQIASENTDFKAKFLKEVKAVGPYINFFVKNEEKAKHAIEQEIKFKKSDEKVMIEFSQPNTHKEFHIGHLRNASLGDSLVRLNKFTGKKVVSANYIGDIGTHVAKALWYFKKHYNAKAPEGNKGRFLGKLYVEATKEAENNPEAKEEISKVLQSLENREPEITKLWEKTKEWSLQEFKSIYKELDIDFEKWYFESEEDNPGKEIANELLKKGIAEKSDGAVIVDLEKENAKTAVILKSDGTSLYLTKDLSLAQKKFKEYDLDKSVYVIDSRQSLHMKQVFEILKKMGFDKEMIHLPYEFVGTKSGAFSSRKGNAPLYRDVKEKLVTKLVKETEKRRVDWTNKKINETAEAICISAFKFGMLKVDNNRTITFDENEWLDFEGETGPYIQYTYARIKSILRKVKTTGKKDYSELNTKEDDEIIKLLLSEKNNISEAEETNKPHLIARYSLQLAQKTNEYYHKHRVADAEETVKNARIELLTAVSKSLERNLDLIGIKALEEM